MFLLLMMHMICVKGLDSLCVIVNVNHKDSVIQSGAKNSNLNNGACHVNIVHIYKSVWCEHEPYLDWIWVNSTHHR